MAIMPGIRNLVTPEGSSSTVGNRRDTPNTHHPGVIHEDALRAMLTDCPNNVEAFNALVKVVARNLANCPEGDDPLTADNLDTADETIAEKIKTARWALAEEYSGNPRAWRPLLVLAELSITEQPQEAFRRINTALERDATGNALAEAVHLLITHNEAILAFSHSRGHWKSGEHIPEAGVAVVRAALECNKTHEAERALAELLTTVTPKDVEAIDAHLINDVHKAKQK